MDHDMDYDIDYSKKLTIWQNVALIAGSFAPAIAYVANVYTHFLY